MLKRHQRGLSWAAAKCCCLFGQGFAGVGNHPRNPPRNRCWALVRDCAGPPFPPGLIYRVPRTGLFCSKINLSSPFIIPPLHGVTLATLHRSFPAAAGAFYPLPSTSRHLAERDYPSLRHSPNPGAAREVTTQGFFLQSASLSGKPGTTFVFSLLSPQRKCPRDQLQNSGVTTPTELLRPAVTGHKTPRLFVPAAGATLRVGTDPTPRRDIPNL